MARDLPEADGLYRHLNTVNRTIRYGRVYHEDRRRHRLHRAAGRDLDPRELQNACECIGSTSDTYDNDLVAELGGRFFFPDNES